ncbi:MAG: TadE family protein [Chloroflexota bacterium]
MKLTDLTKYRHRWKLATRPTLDRASLRRGRTSRGQSLVEMTLMLPILMLIFAVVLEGTLAFNAWSRVNTAARDATRFTLDAGRPAETVDLVIRKLSGLDTGQMNIYIIKGVTDLNGDIGIWDSNHAYGTGAADPVVTPEEIQALLQNQGVDPSRDVSFAIVEVSYVYNPLVLGAFLGSANLPMRSYAIIQQY